MKKKVLLLGDVNSSHTRKWAAGVAGLGFEVMIYSISEENGNWSERAGVKVFSTAKPVDRTTYSGKDSSKSIYLFRLPELKKAIRSFQPDILHAHYATSYGLLAALTNFHPLVISVWGSDILDFPKRSFLHKSIVKYNLRKADVIISTGKILADETKKYTKTKIEVIPFGVNTDLFTPRAVSHPVFTIGMIKSFEKTYGIDYLLVAFQQLLKKSGRDMLKLVIAGEGSLLGDYTKLIADMELSDAVELPGKISHDRVPEMLNRFDVFVNPSLRESFGVSILEASACGLPVVASDTGGIPEVVVDKSTGLLVPPADSDAIEKAISFFIENPTQINIFGNNGRKMVLEKFDWNKNLKSISLLYSALIES